MPTYEYECTRCKHHFEVFQSIKAEPLKRCPKCKSKVKRLVGSGAGIIFKGSGFYQTDYRSEGYKKSQKADKNTSESAPKPSADSKPGPSPSPSPSPSPKTKAES